MQMQYLDTSRKDLIVCLIFSGDCLSHNKTIGGYPVGDVRLEFVTTESTDNSFDLYRFCTHRAFLS